MMTCRTISPLLSALVDGQLSEGQAARVREHAGGCARCGSELMALRALGSQLASLTQATVIPASPSGLLAGLQSLPGWVVRLALLRRWFMAGGALAGSAGLVILLLQWAGPLPATLTARSVQHATQRLSPGTTLVAQPGETVTVNLPRAGGAITLHGPGGLVVHEAALGKLRQDQRLTLELPSGSLDVHIAPRAPLHTIQLLTPQAHIRLSGTWVLLNASAVSTNVMILEGEAWLRGVATPRAIRLKQGQMAQVKAGWLSVGQIPMEEWLRRKGVIAPTPAPSPAASESAAPSAPSPLSHEQTELPSTEP